MGVETEAREVSAWLAASSTSSLKLIRLEGSEPHELLVLRTVDGLPMLTHVSLVLEPPAELSGQARRGLPRLLRLCVIDQCRECI